MQDTKLPFITNNQNNNFQDRETSQIGLDQTQNISNNNILET